MLSDVSYMGHLLTKEGLRPDPQKIAAITKMPPPQDVAGVRRLLGLVNYLARFVPNLADLCEPIRQLTHKRNEWQWSHVQDNAFTTLKEAITRVPVLQFFNTTKEVTIQCDASDTGLGAALLQEGQPVEFASRALTPTERQYAQIEESCLPSRDFITTPTVGPWPWNPTTSRWSPSPVSHLTLRHGAYATAPTKIPHKHRVQEGQRNAHCGCPL